ncbi:hypothetical protein EYF80_046721 [Liparis tanakae]|uniref:Uncharacterized protein n=1 Tax=Liparis tanakae TaxID=230148 RepID=A0A4Z2FPD4_9TELE|nr:hypothetical protein EYF80_046721 [Liparis tanakae]
MSQQLHMLLLWQSDENPGCAEGFVSTVETLHREKDLRPEVSRWKRNLASSVWCFLPASLRHIRLFSTLTTKVTGSLGFPNSPLDFVVRTVSPLFARSSISIAELSKDITLVYPPDG